MIKAKLLNSEASLNDYFHLDAIEFVPGENVTVAVQILNSQKDIRFIPPEDAVLTLTFLNKDGSVLEKEAELIDEDDRSMWKVELSQAETTLLAGQTIQVELDVEGDGTEILKAVMNNVFVRVNLSGDC